jgi:cytochrome c biogenesis protein CcdA
MEPCTAIGCFLEQYGGLVNLPLVTLAGLADGINPCAIGMMVMLLGYLLIFANPVVNTKRKTQNAKQQLKVQNGLILKLGGIYIVTVFLTYLIIGLGFYSAVSQLQQVIHVTVVNRVIGLILGMAAVIMLKDVVWPESPVHLRIPGVSREGLMKLIEKISIPGTIGLGIAVTVLETPCSLPLYVGTATILANSGMALPLVVGYFWYYNLLFVMPLILVLVLVWKGKKIVEMKEWEHRAEKFMKLTLGLLLLLVSGWLLLV